MPSIKKGSQHMQVVTYTGNGGIQQIEVGFKIGLLWIKSRSAATNHKVVDVVRGATKALITNTNGAETTDTNGVITFTDTGFRLGSDSVYNANGATYVAWCWKAGDSLATSNAGSIISQVSVNQEAGFSVVTYTGKGSASTVGHGLNSAPSMIITKNLSNTYVWACYHRNANANPASGYLSLNSNSAFGSDSTIWNNTAPTSSVFSIGSPSGGTNLNGDRYVSYCWSEIAGYSKFGSYSTNASVDGPFVYTGFRPSWILLKAATAVSGGDWVLIDTARNNFNVSNKWIFPNASTAESNYVNVLDVLSNGFKIRTNWDTVNASGATMTYAAFAENPFNYSTAR